MTILPNFLAETLISFAPVPIELDGTTARGVLWQASAECFMLDLPNIARYLVEAGVKITIDPATGSDKNDIYRFLRMTPLAALLYQRGLIVFHAAAVAINDRVVLLAGDSGAGKSILLTAMLQRGWTMLSDDLTVVEKDEKGQLFVHSMYPDISLWPDSLIKLGIEASALPFSDANRLGYSMPDQFASGTKLLDSIYWLSINNKNCVELSELEGKFIFNSIGSLLYNSHIANALLNKVTYMGCIAAVARSVPIHLLKRPRELSRIDEMAEVITLSSQE